MLIALIGTNVLSLERSGSTTDNSRRTATTRDIGGATLVAPQNTTCTIDAGTLPTPIVAQMNQMHPVIFLSTLLILAERLSLRPSPRYRIGPSPPFLAVALQGTYLRISLLLN